MLILEFLFDMAKTKNHNLRIAELIENGFDNSDIARLILKEHRIRLTVAQVNRKRNKEFLIKIKTDHETKTNDTVSKIEGIMKSHNCSAKSSKEIKDTFYSLFGKKLSKEEFNSIAWGPLKQKFNHCRVTWTYQWKRDPVRVKEKATNPLLEIEEKLKNYNPFQVLKNGARKNFIKVNSGNKKIDELIRTVVKDNRITPCEEEFLTQKTKELNLPISILNEAKRSLHENNPYLDNLIHLVFEDGIITKEELKFLKEKVIENEFNPTYFNIRFWQIGLIHYMDYLMKYDSFVNLVKYWGVNQKLELDENINDEYYFNSLNIFESSDFEILLEKGEEKIKHYLASVLINDGSKFLIEDTINFIKSPAKKDSADEIANEQTLNSQINLLRTIINEEKRRIGSPQANLLAENILHRIEHNSI